MNASGLSWIFSKRSQEVAFMDLHLKIEGKRIKSPLYAKPMALHLYLPPHSCHAPGVLPGLIFGNVFCIHQLCSNVKDIEKELKLFFHQLLDRGYQSNQLTPPFQQAINNAKAYLQRTAKGYNIPIKRLTIAWHCPPNLGNLLSYRKVNNRKGLKVSSSITT